MFIRTKWQAASSWKCRREDDTWGLCRHASLSSSAAGCPKQWDVLNISMLQLHNFTNSLSTHLLSMTATNLGISPVHSFTVAWNGIHPWRHCIAWDHLGTWMVRIPPRVKGFVQREHLSPQTSVQYPPPEITSRVIIETPRCWCCCVLLLCVALLCLNNSNQAYYIRVRWCPSFVSLCFFFTLPN